MTTPSDWSIRPLVFSLTVNLKLQMCRTCFVKSGQILTTALVGPHVNNNLVVHDVSYFPQRRMIVLISYRIKTRNIVQHCFKPGIYFRIYANPGRRCHKTRKYGHPALWCQLESLQTTRFLERHWRVANHSNLLLWFCRVARLPRERNVVFYEYVPFFWKIFHQLTKSWVILFITICNGCLKQRRKLHSVARLRSY